MPKFDEKSWQTASTQIPTDAFHNGIVVSSLLCRLIHHYHYQQCPHTHLSVPQHSSYSIPVRTVPTGISTTRQNETITGKQQRSWYGYRSHKAIIITKSLCFVPTNSPSRCDGTQTLFPTLLRMGHTLHVYLFTRAVQLQ